MKLPDVTVGVSSPCFFVGERNPSEVKDLRFHPAAGAGGFSRKGINFSHSTQLICKNTYILQLCVGK